jgi:hypothetical protein
MYLICYIKNMCQLSLDSHFFLSAGFANSDFLGVVKHDVLLNVTVNKNDTASHLTSFQHLLGFFPSECIGPGVI